MKEFTVEELVKAIRNSTDLNELKYMVGPSEEEQEKARIRMAVIDAI